MPIQVLPITADRRAILRETFITRANRPTYDELAEEFGVNPSTCKNWAADESWVTLRVAHQEKLAEKSDALGIVLKATQIDRRLVESCSDAVLRGFQSVSRIYDQLDMDRAPSTNAQTVNTLSFATKNLAESCKLIGIVGLPKGLADDGKEANGRWNPQMLHQLNVTVQNITKEAEAAKAVPSKVEDVD